MCCSPRLRPATAIRGTRTSEGKKESFSHTHVRSLPATGLSSTSSPAPLPPRDRTPQPHDRSPLRRTLCPCPIVRCATAASAATPSSSSVFASEQLRAPSFGAPTIPGQPPNLPETVKPPDFSQLRAGDTSYLDPPELPLIQSRRRRLLTAVRGRGRGRGRGPKLREVDR